MDPIDVDEILEIDYLDSCAEVTFKDGSVRQFNGAEHPEIFEILNHWSPPTA